MLPKCPNSWTNCTRAPTIPYNLTGRRERLTEGSDGLNRIGLDSIRFLDVPSLPFIVGKISRWSARHTDSRMWRAIVYGQVQVPFSVGTRTPVPKNTRFTYVWAFVGMSFTERGQDISEFCVVYDTSYNANHVACAYCLLSCVLVV